MKRIGYSFSGGIILSLLIFFSSAAGSLIFHDFSQGPGHSNIMQKIATFPLLWSTYLGEFLFPQTYERISRTAILAVYIAVCNILFYSVLVYLFFPVWRQFKGKEIKTTEPPEPPIF
jgi:hypothetical protein